LLFLQEQTIRRSPTPASCAWTAAWWPRPTPISRHGRDSAFREDLYFRLNHDLTIPPCATRGGHPIWSISFLATFASQARAHAREPEAMRRMLDYAAGHVRELKQCTSPAWYCLGGCSSRDLQLEPARAPRPPARRP
jgi:DNA-binding NtrC family response regulator